MEVGQGPNVGCSAKGKKNHNLNVSRNRGSLDQIIKNTAE
jgi:hypothetical protein